MPRVWSALLPDACKPAQQPVTAADTSELQAKASSQALAQEVLQAGRLCSAAVAKLQAALGGSNAGDDAQLEAHAAHHHAQQQLTDWSKGKDGAAAAAATGAVEQAACPERSLDTPLGLIDTRVLLHGAPPKLTSSSGQGGIAPAGDAVMVAAEHHAHPGSLASPVAPSGPLPESVSAAMLTREADDGYISLENQSVAIATDKQIPQIVQGYMAAAESTDSQGSLPGIDSGESSDSSSSQ